MEKIIIYTDGASKGNPGPGGWGAIVVGGGKAKELGGGEKHTTNNRMEMMGALEALRYASKLPPVPTVVHTDSSYVINGITKWVRGWKAKGWMTAQKKEVINKELWQELANVVDSFNAPIEWKYVGGHIGIAGNERVDEIANAFALGKHITLHSGAHENYGVDVHNTSHDEALKKTKSDSRSRSRGKAHSYVSLVEGVVQVHKTWGECEARVRGKKARFKKALTPDEERRIIFDFSRP
jgi:ribonuclease HI